MTVVGTRPELIRLSCVIKRLDKHVDHILVHTGQNYDYELNEIFFTELGLRKPDYFLSAAGQTAVETAANTIVKVEKIILKEKPDAFLILGDTNSCLSAYAAKRHKVPIFHMEAGNRCFDMRVPEEINRRLVDHMSDVNLTYSEHARNYLLKEGLSPELIIKTGSPLLEIFNEHMDKIKNSDILQRLALSAQQFFIVSIHREENVDCEAHFKEILATLKKIETTYHMPIIISTHPRTRKKIEASEMTFNDNIKFMRPFGFIDYVHLQMNAFCVISDSGSVTEEASILGFPAITMRQAHERPEGTDEGTLIMSGFKHGHVLESIRIVTSDLSERRATKIVSDYNTDNVSLKVLRAIMSYTEYVNRVTWHKG